MPIIPVTFAARPSGRLGSWDRTLLPYPFSRGLYIYGEPVVVPRDADEPALESVRLSVEQTLDRLTDQADRALGLAVEDARPPVES